MTDDLYASVADLYDLSYGDYLDDVDFFASLAEIGDGSVLELGVGTGRAAIPLAQQGFKVTGIDTSQAMLTRAREKASRLKLKAGDLKLFTADMTNFALEDRFGLVFVAADTFQHLLTTRSQQQCIARVAKHLQPGGIFALSVRSPVSVNWEEPGAPSSLLLDWTRRDEQTGELVMKFIAASADPARMVRSMTYIYDHLHDGIVQRSVFMTDLRYSSQSELELLLQQEGLRVTHVYGDYDLSPVGLGDNLILVARAEDSV